MISIMIWRFEYKNLCILKIYHDLSLSQHMSMCMPRIMVVQMLVHGLAMNMHMLMHEIRFHEKLVVGEDISWLVIQLDPVILAHHDGPLADHLYDLQVMSGGDYRLPSIGQLAEQLDQPKLGPGVKPGRWLVQQ